MIGNKLITKQTGEAGRICNAVMLAEARPPAHEYYVALLNDRASQLPVLIASNQGGMSIEDVAAENPDAIITTPIDFEKGLEQSKALEIAKKLGFSSPKQEEQAADTFVKLYKLFKEKDATQVEINPLAESKDGEVLCMDAKLGFDDNAVEFRQPDIAELRDPTQEDADEVEAGKKGLNFIKLDGDIGCLVNGAGLAMATMDVVKLNGGSPANFLDIGGGADAEAMKLAFKLLLSAKPKALFGAFLLHSLSSTTTPWLDLTSSFFLASLIYQSTSLAVSSLVARLLSRSSKRQSQSRRTSTSTLSLVFAVTRRLTPRRSLMALARAAVSRSVLNVSLSLLFRVQVLTVACYRSTPSLTWTRQHNSPSSSLLRVVEWCQTCNSNSTHF